MNELERALSAGEIDLAVHSAKDVPGELADGLALLGAPARAAAEDVLCIARAMSFFSDANQPAGLEQLAPGARVGTSSVRRAAQLLAAREDLEVVAVRGNVDTRLRKLREGSFDALVLARAGLQRLGREAEVAAVLDPARFVPSPGEGTLALEGRADDDATRAAVQAITDAKTFACLQAERAIAHALGASCNTPLGAHAVDYGCGCLHLHAWVGLPDGSAWVGDELRGLLRPQGARPPRGRAARQRRRRGFAAPSGGVGGDNRRTPVTGERHHAVRKRRFFVVVHQRAVEDRFAFGAGCSPLGSGAHTCSSRRVPHASTRSPGVGSLAPR